MKQLKKQHVTSQMILKDLFELLMKTKYIQVDKTDILQDFTFLISKFGPSDELKSQIFKVNKNTGLRYDLTMPMLKNIRQNITRAQIGSVFRNSPNSSTRFKEFIQADLDSTQITFEKILKIMIKNMRR